MDSTSAPSSLIALSDDELARHVSRQAGELLVNLRSDFGRVSDDDKPRLTQLRDLADRASHQLIMDLIRAGRPDDAILSEEGVDQLDRDSADRVWIVDPLDGTREYALGLDEFAVHVALWEKSATTPEKLVAASVDLPARSQTYATTDAPKQTWSVPSDRPIRIVVSRTRPPAIAVDGLDALAARLRDAGLNEHGVEVANVGSAGAKTAEVLAGRADAYMHDTGFYEWDVAAPLAVAAHYGLTASHLDRSPVVFNNRPPWVSDLIVCLPELTDHLLA